MSAHVAYYINPIVLELRKYRAVELVTKVEVRKKTSCIKKAITSRRGAIHPSGRDIENKREAMPEHSESSSHGPGLRCPRLALRDLAFASGRTMNLSVFLLEYFTDIINDFIVILPGVTR
jgi:hypothetical protein